MKYLRDLGQAVDPKRFARLLTTRSRQVLCNRLAEQMPDDLAGTTNLNIWHRASASHGTLFHSDHDNQCTIHDLCRTIAPLGFVSRMRCNVHNWRNAVTRNFSPQVKNVESTRTVSDQVCCARWDRKQTPRLLQLATAPRSPPLLVA